MQNLDIGQSDDGPYEMALKNAIEMVYLNDTPDSLQPAMDHLFCNVDVSLEVVSEVNISLIVSSHASAGQGRQTPTIESSLTCCKPSSSPSWTSDFSCAIPSHVLLLHKIGLHLSSVRHRYVSHARLTKLDSRNPSHHTNHSRDGL